MHTLLERLSFSQSSLTIQTLGTAVSYGKGKKVLYPLLVLLLLWH